MIEFTKRTLRSKLFLNSSIATFDQAMLSVLNFIISIILIKSVSKVEFGYYSIALSIVFFLFSVQNAIINTPLAVLLVEKTGNIRQKYIASLCYGQFIIILPAAFLGITAAGLMYLGGFDPIKSFLVAAVSLATIGFAFREFIRAYYFAEETPLRVLKLDMFYVLLFLSLIIFSHFFNKFNISAVFIMNGVSGFIVALFFVRHRGWLFDKQSIKESYSENWKFGKWALLGVIVTHIQNYSLIYFLGALIGSAAVADVSAARLLIMPVLLAKMGWAKIVIPHGSNLRENNQINRFFMEQAVMPLFFIISIIVYVFILMSFSGILNRFLFTNNYVNSFIYVKYWGGVFIIGFISVSANYGLQVIKEFSILSKLNVLTMLVTVGCAYFFIQMFGIIGGFVAQIVGGALSAIVLWYFFTKRVFPVEDGQPISNVKKNTFSQRK